MRDGYRSLLTVLAAILALWLILGFWSLPVSAQAVLSLLIVLACSVALWRQRVASRSDAVCDLTRDSLPPEDFQGAVVLVCGDNESLFASGARHHETRQGWYLEIQDPEQLPVIVQHLAFIRQALVPQISVLLAIQPERHTSQDDFTRRLYGWQRAVVQCRAWLGCLPPVWTVTWISPPGAWSEKAPVWFSCVDKNAGLQIHQSGRGLLPLTDWMQESDASGHFSRLSQLLWLDALLEWQKHAVDSLLAEQQGGLLALKLRTRGYCITPVSGQQNNLWQQHITDITTLPPEGTVREDVLPLPGVLLSGLPRQRGISTRMRYWRYTGLLVGTFLALAMTASFINNQRLIRQVGDHLALYHRLSGEPAAPKLQAQQHLRTDAGLLDEWQRRGEPLRYRLGLYQGGRLIAPTEAAISGWAPLQPSQPVTKKIVKAPVILRLDSISLFDSGRSDLKTGSTRMLVSSLMDIKARPGWLIVVAGHTDNTGNPARNRALSLKRAEAVRDWMRDTGDIPESCFAVQGYGESRPIATNDTPEARARNRRVEISLVPQADACPLPGETPASSQDDDAENNVTE